LALVLAVYGIVFTHKVAGPLFKAQRYFQSIAAGDLQRIPNLRKGDQLRDFWAEFRLMQESLRERAERDAEVIEGVIAAMEASADAHSSAKEAVQEQVDQLRALAVRVRNALEGKVDTKADTDPSA
jgi:methyl-accepting chemotaxis protein